MNIHEAARKVLEGEELPEIEKAKAGICRALYFNGCNSAYDDIGYHMEMCGSYVTYLPNPGTWTDQRLNIICLLAITEPEDFE